jgi:hypothetical protein
MGAGPLPPAAGGSGPAGVRDQASLFPG